MVPELKRPYPPIGGLLEIETGKEYQKAKSLKESAMEQKEGYGHFLEQSNSLL